MNGGGVGQFYVVKRVSVVAYSVLTVGVAHLQLRLVAHLHVLFVVPRRSPFLHAVLHAHHLAHVAVIHAQPVVVLHLHHAVEASQAIVADFHRPPVGVQCLLQ